METDRLQEKPLHDRRRKTMGNDREKIVIKITKNVKRYVESRQSGSEVNMFPDQKFKLAQSRYVCAAV